MGKIAVTCLPGPSLITTAFILMLKKTGTSEMLIKRF